MIVNVTQREVALLTAGCGWLAMGIAELFAPTGPLGMAIVGLLAFFLLFTLADERRWIDTSAVGRSDPFEGLSAAETARRCRRYPPAGTTKMTRRDIFSREGGQCFWCERRIDRDGFHLDHVVPLYIGGPAVHRVENLVASCINCNELKGAREPLAWAQELFPTRVAVTRRLIDALPGWPAGEEPMADRSWTAGQTVLVSVILATAAGVAFAAGAPRPAVPMLAMTAVLGALTAGIAGLAGLTET
jgi:hypothetical protein